MAKKKSKASSTVNRRHDPLRAPLAGPKDHDRDSDGSVILALPFVPPTKPDVVPCAARPDSLPSSPSQPCDVGLSTPHPASELVVASGSKVLDAVVVKDCSTTSDDETMEDQLDLNFFDKECGDSPQSFALFSGEKVSPPPPLPPAKKILPPTGDDGVAFFPAFWLS